jgi:hypothetical protein
VSEDEEVVPLGLDPDYEYEISARGPGADAVHTAWFERPSNKGLEIWGYTDRVSYSAGDEIVLHVHTTAPVYDVRIERDGAEPQPVFKALDQPGTPQQTPQDAYAKGCGWQESLRLSVPEDWKSGGYRVEFACQKDGIRRVTHHWFAIRPAPGPRTGKILLIAATGTWLAYNDWGGANHYEGETIPNGFSPTLSTQRPWARGQIWLPAGAPRIPLTENVPMGWVPRYPNIEWAYAQGYSKYCAAAGWGSFERHFMIWAEGEGYAVDLVTQHDLHESGDWLGGYSAAVIVGHDEYWSAPARDHLDAWVDAGGHLARFAGNYIWQTRISEDGRTQTCYKYAAPEQDEVMGTDREHLLTAAWDHPATGRPGALTMGASGMRGCYSRMGGWRPRASGGYTVYRQKSWVFEGTDLYYGDVFGAEAQITGFEVDGLDYQVRYGKPYPTGADGVGEDQVTILAMSVAGFFEEDHGNPGTNLYAGDGDAKFAAETLYGDHSPENMEKVEGGCGTMVLYHRGQGEIFNAGAVEWVNGLRCAEPFTEKITRNVLDRYLAREG